MTELPFWASAAVPLDAFYIERPVDRLYIDGLRAGVGAGRGAVHIYGSRQCGKSSLILRAVAELGRDHAVAHVDLAAVFPNPELASSEFWERIVGATAWELGIDPGSARKWVAALGPGRAFAELAASLRRPLIVIFDEVDVLGVRFRRELSTVLRAVMQRRVADSHPPRVPLNFSLCGVEPPVATDESAIGDGKEPVEGRLHWIDDFSDEDGLVARQICEAFSERAQPRIKISQYIAREILDYTGGYPQAISWVGNQLAKAVWSGNVALDEDYRLAGHVSQLARRFFLRELAQSPDDMLEQESTKGWLRTLENYLMTRPGVSEGALAVYEAVLNAYMQGNRRLVRYEPPNVEHQLVRYSGLGRVEADGTLRLRAPVFADAFGSDWIGRAWQWLADEQRKQSVTRVARQGPSKKLLIIGTGGTIGMAERQGLVGPAEDRPEWIRQVEGLLGTMPDFQKAFDLDSADVGPVHWEGLVQRIVRAQGKYDGIVVAHGTDTMAYSASAVAFALGADLSFPVVFTGSQTTTDVMHGDAISNILRSALVAAHGRIQEVVVCFGEKIFRATRTQKKDDRRFDAFESPGYPELGFVAEDVQLFEGSLRPEIEPGRELTGVSAEFASGILHISQMPGSNAAFYEAALAVMRARDPNELVGERAGDGASGGLLCRGIVIQSLGAGNVPTDLWEFDLTSLIQEATNRHIPVVLTSQYPVLPANYRRYTPSERAVSAGAIATGNMTISAVVAKLSWVIPQVDRLVLEAKLRPEERVGAVKAMMYEEYVGEGGFKESELGGVRVQVELESRA